MVAGLRGVAGGCRRLDLVPDCLESILGVREEDQTEHRVAVLHRG